LTWKSSPRSIGFDADENGQSRQAQRQIPIPLDPAMNRMERFDWQEECCRIELQD
jgi:hypothetical protein